MRTKIKLIIFDFDNCIADTLPALKKVTKELAPKYLKRKINLEKVLRREGIRALIRRSGCRLWRIPFLVRRFRKMMRKDFHKVKVHRGMILLIRRLSKYYALGIITSNSKQNANQFLKKYKLKKEFDFIKTNVSLFTKAWWLRRYVRKYKLKKSEVVMIGDETRDIHAAKKAGIKSMAVTWGINSRALLKKQKPTYVVNSAKSILKYL